MTKYSVIVNTDAYSMPLYQCDGMSKEEVHDWLLETNCLEPEEYELITYFIEE